MANFCAFLLLAFLLCADVSTSTSHKERKYLVFYDRQGRLRVTRLDKEYPVPQINPENDVKFHLYTRSQSSSPYFLKVNDGENLQSSSFNPANPTKIIIHGWQSSADGGVVIGPKKSYLSKGDYNVIGVDWSGLADNILYNVVAEQTQPVGDYVARLIEFLVGVGGAKLSDVHVMGHSLGAHVAGYAGANISIGAIPRITGLDPAGPLFESKGPGGRLDASDAAFVDVIHTNIGILGISYSVGDVDFYPNGASDSQPGCGLDLTGTCSHSRAHEYMAESIVSGPGFVSKQCTNWEDFNNDLCASAVTTLMGENVDKSATSNYYLRTDNSSPFALGAAGAV